MKVPTDGTKVFYPNAVPQGDTRDSSGVSFPPDLVTTFSRDGTNRSTGYLQFQFADRLRSLGIPNDTLSGSGCPALISSSTAAEVSSATYVQLKADGRNITCSNGWNSALYGNWIYYFIQRAPGFFDEVCWTGTNADQTLTHNLAAVPELIIFKTRSVAGYNWSVGTNFTSSDFTNLVLNGAFSGSTVSYTGGGAFSARPTSTQFSVGQFSNPGTMVAYLFATCPGVSKVGSYTGTAATQVINCGFTGGARFVLIRRTDSTGDWYVWDSARGIVAGDDPYLLLNSSDAEVTSTDYVDTAASGFELTSTAPAAINASGGSYIFLAIA